VFSLRIGRISVKAQLQLRASAASRFHEFAIPWNAVNVRNRLRASVVLQGSGFAIFRDRETPCVHRLMPGRAVVLRIEPPLASRPFGFHH
jgi:hypothetical protein